MRKLSTFLLPAAAVGALIASSLAVSATPAAAETWGYGHGGYERHEQFDRFRRGERFERFDRHERFRHEGRGYDRFRYGHERGR